MGGEIGGRAINGVFARYGKNKICESVRPVVEAGRQRQNEYAQTISFDLSRPLRSTA